MTAAYEAACLTMMLFADEEAAQGGWRGSLLQMPIAQPDWSAFHWFWNLVRRSS